jgi:hypothetical protein
LPPPTVGATGRLTMIPEEVGKGLDATKAVAETAGKAVDTINGFGGFLGKLFSPAAEEIGLAFRDQIAFRRKMRLLNFEARFQRKCEVLGFDPETIRPVPLSIAYKIVEEASLEEADEIQELWAELLAKSVDPSSEFSATKMHISLLKELSPSEALLLKALFEIDKTATELPQSSALSVREQVEAINSSINDLLESEWRTLGLEQRQIAARNLTRLGCITCRILDLPSLQKLISEVPTGGQNRYGGAITATRIDIKQFNQLLEWIVNGFSRAAGIAGAVEPQAAKYRYPSSSHVIGELDAPETGYVLTEVGRDLVRAVIPNTPNAHSTPPPNPPQLRQSPSPVDRRHWRPFVSIPPHHRAG